MLASQMKVGNVKNGERIFIKLAGDGFNIARRSVGTAHTITVSDKTKALQIGTVSIVDSGESYQVSSSSSFF